MLRILEYLLQTKYAKNLTKNNSHKSQYSIGAAFSKYYRICMIA